MPFNIKEIFWIRFTPSEIFEFALSTDKILQGLEGCCEIDDNGNLQVAKLLDRETTTSYSGTLQCDLGPPDYLTSHTIFINISEYDL